MVPFDSELQIGYDGFYRNCPRSVRRVRRISATKLYLLDFGKIINYEKSKCFQLPKVFQTIPTRVSHCGLDGLKWAPAAIPSFDNIRDVVQKGGQMNNSTLHAITCGFHGAINMINLFCGNSKKISDQIRYFIDRILQKFWPSAFSKKVHANNEATAKISNDADVIKDLPKNDGVENIPLDSRLQKIQRHKAGLVRRPINILRSKSSNS